MTSILDQYPEIRERNIEEDVYRIVVSNNGDLDHYDIENIGLAFAISQRRSDQRRSEVRRWWSLRRRN